MAMWDYRPRSGLLQVFEEATSRQAGYLSIVRMGCSHIAGGGDCRDTSVSQLHGVDFVFQLEQLIGIISTNYS